MALGVLRVAASSNPVVERDGHKLRLWFPTLRSGHPSLLR